MARVANVVIDRRKMLLLKYLRDVTAEGEASLSMRSIASVLGLSPSKARCAVKSLEADGSVIISSRFDEDGGRLANSYEVTPKGRCFLDVAGDVKDDHLRKRKEF